MMDKSFVKWAPDYVLSSYCHSWDELSSSVGDRIKYITARRFPLPCSCQPHGSLARYVTLRVVHAPGMPGTFPRHRLQRKPLVSDPGMHHGTCVTRVPWCMSGSLIGGGGGNVPGIPRACATPNFTYLVRGPWRRFPIVAEGNPRKRIAGHSVAMGDVTEVFSGSRSSNYIILHRQF